MATFAEYTQYDAMGLAELIQTNAVKPEEVLEAAIARAESVNPQINAIIHPAYSWARNTPAKAGALSGVPFLIKDLGNAWAGMPLENGSQFWKGYLANFTSTLNERYRDAGLVFMGKTNTPEFGLTPFTEPVTYGATHNPWKLGYTAGGSSGGSAAAVAAGIVPAAHAGDGGGSIRIPASCCGLFGLKPSRGRNPSGPYSGDSWWGAVAEHVVSRTVRDSALLLDLTSGADIGAPHSIAPPKHSFLSAVSRAPKKLKIAYHADPLMVKATLDPECELALEKTVQLLRDLGHEVIEAKPTFDAPALRHAFMTMLMTETAGEMAMGEKVRQKKPKPSDFEAKNWALYVLSKNLSAGEISLARRQFDLTMRDMGRFMANYDVWLTPTVAQPPFQIGALQSTGLEAQLTKLIAHLPLGGVAKKTGVIEQIAEKIFSYIPYTPLTNVSGQPSMSVPLCRTTDGLPMGMMFSANFGREDLLFSLAGQLERAQPWELVAPL